jgi:hypothetical protein
MNTIKYLILAVFIWASVSAFSQTATVTLSQTNNGSNIDVSFYIQRTSVASYNLGDVSLVININDTAVNVSSGTVIVKGPYDVTNNTNYGSMFIGNFSGRPGGVNKSLETVLNSAPGAPVPNTPTLIGTIRFPITNPAANHNIYWDNGASALSTDVGFGDIITTFVNPSNGPLPVELAAFSASTVRNLVELSWTTNTETNNKGFDVERMQLKADGSEGQWNNAGYKEGNGTTQEQKSYTFTDRNLQSGKYKYRLKQTDYNGNFKYYDLNTDVIVGIPTKFDLSQNYPNPFNPSTKINVDLPKDTKVSLKIYDLSGREIAVLINNEQRPAGYYTVEFNGSSLASGIYFYRIITEQNTAVKKMALVK